MIWIVMALLSVGVSAALLWNIWNEFKRSIQSEEEQFWANKCHEAFNEAQVAFKKGDEYSFRKFCEQHALYYRRYQMARSGHFEKRINE